LRNVVLDKYDDGDDDKDVETEGVARYAKGAEQIEVETDEEQGK
jgi:hypothetical protein